jgi:hypothetical protein
MYQLFKHLLFQTRGHQLRQSIFNIGQSKTTHVLSFMLFYFKDTLETDISRLS